jgi:hypothetical protein
MNGRTLTSLVAVLVACGVYAAGCSTGGGGSGGGSAAVGITPAQSGTLTEGLPVVQRDPQGYDYTAVNVNTIRGGQIASVAPAPVNTAVFVADAPGGNIRLVDDRAVSVSGNTFYEAQSMAVIGTRIYAGSANRVRSGAGDLFEFVNNAWAMVIDSPDSEMVVGSVSSDAFTGAGGGAASIYAAHGGENSEGALLLLDPMTNRFQQIASLNSAIPTAIAGREGRLFVGATDSRGGGARLLKLDVNAQTSALQLVDIQVPGGGGGFNSRQEITSMVSIGTVASGSIVPIVTEVLIVAVGSFDTATGAAISGTVFATDGDQRYEVIANMNGDAPRAVLFHDNTLYVATDAGKLLYRAATGDLVEETTLPATITGIGAAISRDPANMVLGCRSATGAVLLRRIGKSGFVATPTDRYYRPDVKAILQSRCAVCHVAPGLPAATAAYNVTMTNDTTDHTTTRSKVNLTTPSMSLLLAKAIGQQNHLGGPVIQAGSPDYNVLLEWVSQGARFEAATAPPVPPVQAPKTYVADVRPILAAKNCASCHVSQSNFRLTATLSNNTTDHAEVLGEINTTTPELSDILRKPGTIGGVTHGGGRLIPQGSTEYNTILLWIQQGARLQ